MSNTDFLLKQSALEHTANDEWLASLKYSHDEDLLEENLINITNSFERGSIDRDVSQHPKPNELTLSFNKNNKVFN